MEALKEAGNIEILLALSKEPMSVRQLQSETGYDLPAVEKSIQELLGLGLIKEHRLKKLEDWIPRTKRFELTERGTEVVRAIKLQKAVMGLPRALKSGTEWVLALLHSMGGEIKGRIRLQKLMFLLKREYKVPVPYEFMPYIYGPYSADIFEDLASLVDDGLVEVKTGEVSPTRHIRWRTEIYEMVDPLKTVICRLTEKGSLKADEVYQTLSAEAKEALIDLNREFNRLSLRDLVKYVYEHYPDSILSP